MELDAVVQLVTVLVAASAIVWHQQHNTDKLREDLNILRGDFNVANHQHREDLNKLREGITENGQRLARIEGFLGIGIPTVTDESIDAGSG